MITFIYGADSYRRTRRLKELMGAHKKDFGSLGIERFDMGEKDSVAALERFVGTVSMFETRKLAVLDGAFECEDMKKLAVLLKSALENKYVEILIHSGKKAPTAMAFLHKAPVRNEEYPALKTGKDKLAFLRKEAEERGVELNDDLSANILSALGDDTWGIVTELENIALARKSGVSMGAQENYFVLMQALKRGQSPSRRIVALERMLSGRRDDAARVFNSIAYQAKDGDEAVWFAKYDVAVKSGRMDYEEVLLAYALGMYPRAT